MAQAPLKKSLSSTTTSKPSRNPKSKSSTHASAHGITKKGSRTIAPKNIKLKRQMKMNKKLTSGLTAQTEKMLGEKAGHLEMIGQGRDKKGGNAGGKGKGMGGGKGGKKR